MAMRQVLGHKEARAETNPNRKLKKKKNNKKKTQIQHAQGSSWNIW